MTGHSVLQLPVPALEEWVRARTGHYDAGFVSTDPRFGHAHVTALSPFLDPPTPGDLARVGEVAAGTAPVRVRLERLAQFPDGIIHLLPEPDDGLRALTARLLAAFPGLVPYGGAYGDDVRPHVTLDAAAEATGSAAAVDLASTAALLGDAVPVEVVLDRLQLAWWESGRCHVVAEWPLGG